MKKDPITNEIYDYLMNQPKLTKSPKSVYYRNRISITLLYYTGLKVNELCEITWKDLKTALESGILTINQPKTETYKTIRLSPDAIKALANLEKELHYIFRNQDD
uniref:Putative integrase/recombinase protein n=1 Tax=Chaetosphaeridium globosum TaxID=96477 RepID=Q8M1H5_CHAGL|nr:putative integrase/recombinase protein [Chaetosphaeridium globosum]AAM96633.1 putative integrase/recombinase protein [Chaetosphaeridium globosum]